MINNNLLPIAKYGIAKILFFVGTLLVLLILDCDFLSFIVLILSAILIYVYRNPERETIAFENKSVLSPVDGTVLSIEELANSEYAYKIIIDSDFRDIGILRAPIRGKALESTLVNGTRLGLKTPLADKINENATIVFEDDTNNKVSVKHTLKQSFEPISIDIDMKQNYAQGARYGFMFNGVTSLYLPSNFRVNISVGKELRASESLIGYIS